MKDLVAKVCPGTLPRKTFGVDVFTDTYGGMKRRHAEAPVEESKVASSELRPVALCGNDECHAQDHWERDLHAPTLDLDFPCALVPSTTPGHYHLYLDKPMTWRTYKRLLKALGRAGVVEPGYVKASIARKASHVRLPWVTKDD